MRNTLRILSAASALALVCASSVQANEKAWCVRHDTVNVLTTVQNGEVNLVVKTSGFCGDTAARNVAMTHAFLRESGTVRAIFANGITPAFLVRSVTWHPKHEPVTAVHTVRVPVTNPVAAQLDAATNTLNAGADKK